MVCNVAMLSEQGGHRIVLAINGLRLQTPPVEHLAFYAGLGIMAAASIVEWPLAVTLSAGHLLLEATHRPALHSLGEAIEGV